MSLTNWQEIPLFKLLCPDPIPEFSIETSWDLHNQRIIHIDVDRTRSDDLTQSEKILLEHILTLYCKQTNTSYKQGMNEVLVPFILPCRQGMPQHLAYSCFKAFISISLKTMFSDDTFRPLQMMFILIKLLLKYHSPKLSNFFLRHQISPEIYSTSWLLTMYSTKVPDVFLLFELWEEIVRQGDVLFPCYVAVALLDIEGLDLARNEAGLVPVALNRLKILDKPKVQEIIEKSKSFKKIVPVSVSTKLKQYDVYNLQKIEAYIEGLRENICLSILPREIMLLIYPESKICNCSGKCALCDICYPVIIIDCRPREEQQEGHFPNTEFLNEKHLNDLTVVPEQFLQIRGIYHFALMGSDRSDSDLVSGLAKSFIEYEFPYISIIEGGYASCHQFALLFKLEIKNHNGSSCGLCRHQKKVRRKDKSVEVKVDKNELSVFEKRFECVRCDKKGEKTKEKIVLVVSEKEIFLVNKNVVEKFSIKELEKISTVKESKKILVFQFTGIPGKQTFVFTSATHAKDCLQTVTEAFRNQ